MSERLSRAKRLLLLAAGVLAVQLFFLAPSFLGARILLPLDILALERVYFPAQDGRLLERARDVAQADQVLHYVFERDFAARELRAGRLPLWSPDFFCGAPTAIWCKYSPFNLLYCLFPGPRTLPWIHLSVALVAAGGAYLFLRRVLGLGAPAALCGAWALPATGFFQLWLGYPLTYVAAWLPWILLGTEHALRRSRPWSAPALALLTALLVLSGVVTVAAHALIAAALYALGRVAFVRAGAKEQALALARVGLAFAAGLALAAPYLLPLLEYSAQGARIALRAAGVEERPPIGWLALVQLLVPDALGSVQDGGVSLGAPNRMESAAGAYAGLVALLFLVPLALLERRGRREKLVLALLCVVALSWVSNLPGFVALQRLPPFHLLANNRFTFVAGFALLALAAAGLDRLLRGELPGRRASLVGAGLCLALCAWLFAGSLAPPAAIARGLAAESARVLPELPRAEALERLGAPFARAWREGAWWCGLAAGLWVVLAAGLRARPLAALALLACGGELARFGWGLAPQCDPALYYPRLPALEALARMPAGRVLPIFCLPARLCESHGLRDVRGYDAVDPARYLELLGQAESELRDSPPYARTQAYVPALLSRPDDPEGAPRLPPILSLLGVRYLLFQGEPPSGVEPALALGGYWVHENPEAVPRAFVPRRVEWLEGRMALARMARPDFDPAEVAFVEEPLALPAGARGRARVVAEHPTRVELELELESEALVVLADRWDAGWRAELDGRPARVLRVDHELRGVQASPQCRRLVFRYFPAGLARGLLAAGASALALLVWALLGARGRPQRAARPERAGGGVD